jgi:hypothetical protein
VQASPWSLVVFGVVVANAAPGRRTAGSAPSTL